MTPIDRPRHGVDDQAAYAIRKVELHVLGIHPHEPPVMDRSHLRAVQSNRHDRSAPSAVPEHKVLDRIDKDVFRLLQDGRDDRLDPAVVGLQAHDRLAPGVRPVDGFLSGDGAAKQQQRGKQYEAFGK